MRRFIIPIVLAIAGLALAAKLIPGEQAAVAEHLSNFPDADPITHQMRPAVMVGLLMLPALSKREPLIVEQRGPTARIG